MIGLTALSDELIERQRRLDVKVEAGGEGDVADLAVIADLARRIAKQTPTTIAEMKAVAAAAYALAIKDETGAPEARHDLSTALMLLSGVRPGTVFAAPPGPPYRVPPGTVWS